MCGAYQDDAPYRAAMSRASRAKSSVLGPSVSQARLGPSVSQSSIPVLRTIGGSRNSVRASLTPSTHTHIHRQMRLTVPDGALRGQGSMAGGARPNPVDRLPVIASPRASGGSDGDSAGPESSWAPSGTRLAGEAGEHRSRAPPAAAGVLAPAPAASTPLGERPAGAGARPPVGGRVMRLHPTGSGGGSGVGGATVIAERACVCLRCGEAIAAGDDLVTVDVIAERLGAATGETAAGVVAADEAAASPRPVSHARASSRAGGRVREEFDATGAEDSDGYLSGTEL